MAENDDIADGVRRLLRRRGGGLMRARLCRIDRLQRTAHHPLRCSVIVIECCGAGGESASYALTGTYL
ncbi:MAG: hypothetical protein DWQ34_11935 [Planctomycetota bacterium]|nr:MAG: hypothetical protein DWQ34_11935 [Planctomycetota bacterium]REK26166.1 MAG: hypothetical protein DWQ41_10960 [Planctomycetota bacterium]REK33535.1 MAG: hypothetical protein DWQ45_15225 [Planctomycetota bacterium]